MTMQIPPRRVPGLRTTTWGRAGHRMSVGRIGSPDLMDVIAMR